MSKLEKCDWNVDKIRCLYRSPSGELWVFTASEKKGTNSVVI